MRRAAATAAGEVYQVVVTGLCAPVVGAGVGCFRWGDAGTDVAAGGVGVNVAVGGVGGVGGVGVNVAVGGVGMNGALGFGAGVRVGGGGTGVVGRGRVVGDRSGSGRAGGAGGTGAVGRAEGSCPGDRAGGGADEDVVRGAWTPGPPVAVARGPVSRPDGAERVAGLSPGTPASVAAGRRLSGSGRVVGRRPGGTVSRGRDVAGGEGGVRVGVPGEVLGRPVPNVQDGSGSRVGRARSVGFEGVGRGVPPSCATNAHTPRPPRTSRAAPPAIHGVRRGGRR
ncbi:hypothetical protein BU52_16320 [Streptomyces toyocaensis]|uniref:Uncharacterized protein n=1 Tax=Streptomyces toyocaensis TaxID=55952 RepID=A0A081XR12_STRTO|nr:hypothetical protein BU52_16320 [Streptomyces toyocaensis]